MFDHTTYLDLLLLIILLLVCLELLSFLFLRWLRHNFQWILLGKDYEPILNRNALDKFLKSTHHPKLGWIKRPYEKGKEFGVGIFTTEFKINKHGARSCKNFDHLKPEILVFGDSYAFGRQVNDHEVWSSILANNKKKSVYNFGVGNYGLDQAVLRMNDELEHWSPKLIIMMVVPETICRIHSMWKHFSEYGNTFAFKPRFTLSHNKKLTLLKNEVNDLASFLEYPKYLDRIREYDFFYKNKFCKEILFFPYFFSILKKIHRIYPIIWARFVEKFNLERSRNNTFNLIIQRNHKFSQNLFNDTNATNLLSALIKKAENDAKKKGCEFLFCMVPQLQDFNLMENGSIYYKEFLRSISNETNTIDLSTSLKSSGKLKDLYVSDVYGGHLSKLGNQIVAKEVLLKIKKMNM